MERPDISFAVMNYDFATDSTECTRVNLLLNEKRVRTWRGRVV
jgi:hypothetical protein